MATTKTLWSADGTPHAPMGPGEGIIGHLEKMAGRWLLGSGARTQ